MFLLPCQCNLCYSHLTSFGKWCFLSSALQGASCWTSRCSTCTRSAAFNGDAASLAIIAGNGLRKRRSWLKIWKYWPVKNSSMTLGRYFFFKIPLLVYTAAPPNWTCDIFTYFWVLKQPLMFHLSVFSQWTVFCRGWNLLLYTNTFKTGIPVCFFHSVFRFRFAVSHCDNELFNSSWLNY